MKVKFLGQGYEELSENAVGNKIIKFLNSNQYNTFTAFSAFTSYSTIAGLKKHITKAKQSATQINFILGVNQRGTSKEALEAVLDLEINSYIFFHSERFIFHPKIYLFEGTDKSKIIIGSSNLTNNGLFANIESSILVTVNNTSEEDRQFVAQLKSYYEKIFNFSDDNLKKLSDELITKLVEKNIVPTEIEKRLEFSIKKAKQNSKTSLFPTRRLPKIPKEFTTQKPKKKKLKITQQKTGSGIHSEQSYHFPQGVHVGHLLYLLKVIKENTIEESYISSEYLRLQGNLDKGKLGGFQRQTKYKVLALLRMGIVNFNTQDGITLTELGLKLVEILNPILEIGVFDFKRPQALSWEMKHSKNHYKALLMGILANSDEYLDFWRKLILEIPSVTLMLELLDNIGSETIEKSRGIYANFFSFKPTNDYVKKVGISSSGSVSGAEHRCPFLLDLLEIGGFIEQKTSVVTLNFKEE